MRSLYISLLLVASVLSKDCIKKTLCSCEFDDGSGTVDLTSLGHTDNTPAFKDVYCTNEGYYYSYNPCGGFTELACQNATACILNADKSESVQIGDHGRSYFKYDEDSGNVLAAYTSVRNNLVNLRVTTVTLVCDETALDPVLTAQGERGLYQFGLTLKTVCACPGGCSSSGSNTSSRVQ